jgi:polyhydroxybutyrate depolymerase
MPVVVVFHGSLMNGKMMAVFCGMNEKADKEGFIAVYPNGTGAREQLLSFNAGEEHDTAATKPNDVKFTQMLLDDLATHVNVDAKRVYAAGMSNGGMMCYRLAAELPGRFAAIAAVAGTMAVEMPGRVDPIPVLHLHGTDDSIVPYNGPDDNTPTSARFRPVEETIRLWTTADQCPLAEVVDEPDRSDDGTTVKRWTYSPGLNGTEVVLYRIEGGGHTWPGSDTLFKAALGRSTHDISANDVIWEFFEKHPRP